MRIRAVWADLRKRNLGFKEAKTWAVFFIEKFEVELLKSIGKSSPLPWKVTGDGKMGSQQTRIIRKHQNGRAIISEDSEFAHLFQQLSPSRRR